MAPYYYEQYQSDAGYASIELNGLAAEELAGGFDEPGFNSSAWSYVQERAAKRDPRDKVALVLAGGGITGAVYGSLSTTLTSSWAQVRVRLSMPLSPTASPRAKSCS